jgi:hypothetical protein
MVKHALAAVMLACGLAAAWWWQRPAAVVSATQASVPVLVSASSAVRPVGGHPPNAWSVIGGQLVPGRALRDRFDSYLPLGRGVTMVEVRAALALDAQADLGAVLSRQVLTVWDRYARLQTHEWRVPFNNSTPSTWQATLNEQHQVRRQLLGTDWAEAFFSDDEAALQRLMANAALAAAPPSATDVDQVMALAPPAAGGGGGVVPDWHQRSEEARREWARLVQDASLDEGQRLLRMKHYLQLKFTDEETDRIEAELSLP